MCLSESPGRSGCVPVAVLPHMALQPSVTHRVSAIGDLQINDASNGHAEVSRHGHNYIDDTVDQLEDNSEEESDNELELHSEELDHDDSFDRVEDEDWEIVEKGKQTPVISSC